MASNSPSGPDPTLYLYTSLTAGSSHIITATSRLETILKANKIPFRAIDCATDEKARSLWSRRSKGRKIPGLVKYGQVIGDLEAVEEWNEYGEIKENIDNVSDLFGDTPMTDTPMPPPAPITLKDPLAKTTDSQSRSSSETRHISISEPTQKDRGGSASAGSSARNSRDDTPMSLAMRQAGAEAAAKASQKKSNILSSLSSSSTAGALPAKRDSADTTPNPSAMKMSIEAEEPSNDTGMTEGKTPAQLATDGAKKTTTDKIAEQPTADALTSSDSDSDSKSNEEQILDARRQSSVAKQPSRLHQEMSVDDVQTPAPNKSTYKATVPEQAISTETSFAEAAPKANEGRPIQRHRGSSLSEASKEEIRAIEAKNAIIEQPEEESDASHSDQKSALKKSETKSTIQATDAAEADVTKGINPQDQKAKDADAAGVSASLFLSPNHNPNPNRLSADSASVYSFFDSAFSPDPLFSGSSNLDLDLSFIQDLGKADPRMSTSTYDTRDTREDGMDDTASKSSYDDTPRQSRDTQRATSQSGQQQSPQGSPRREVLPSMPTIAPLRTPARRQFSEPLLSSTSNRISTPTSVPLPLTIRKSPTNPITQIPSQAQPTSSSVSQPFLQTNLLDHQLTSPTSTTSSPISITSTPDSRSLRSKKSTQKLDDYSPDLPSLPPNLPPQKQLRDLGVKRSVSENYTRKETKAPRERERGKLLCF